MIINNKRNRKRKCDRTSDDELHNQRYRLFRQEKQCKDSNIEGTSDDNANRRCIVLLMNLNLKIKFNNKILK